MLGFTILLGKDKTIKTNRRPSKQITGDGYHFEFFTNSKFNDDKIFVQMGDFIVVLDGVILNKKALMTQYASSDWNQLFLDLYLRHTYDFPNVLRGEFHGAIYQISANILFSFTNQTATKPVFWTHQNDCLICSSDYFSLADNMKANNLTKTVDEVGFYSMLTYGYFFDEMTYMKEVKKLKAGTCLTYNQDHVTIETYQTFNDKKRVSLGEKDIIEKLDHLFLNAIKSEYEKDVEYNYKHLSTLSAGLDSRANMMIAKKLGFPENFAITCSQSGYYDETVAREISKDFGWEHFFWPLDDAKQLFYLEEYLDHNDGMVFIAGASQHRVMMDQIDCEPYGLLHTGQLGKVGKYVITKQPFPADITREAFTNRFLHKIESDLKPIEQRYSTHEILLIYNRAFNHTNTGYFINEDFTYMVSPFYDVDFLEFTAAIPEKYKYQEGIYYKWWEQKHPEVMSYLWDCIQMKPDKWWKRDYARYINIVRNGIQRKLLKQQHKYEMTPENYWYQTNEKLRKKTEEVFEKHIASLDRWPELKQDAIEQFQEGTYIEKNFVLTAVLTLNRIF